LSSVISTQILQGCEYFFVVFAKTKFVEGERFESALGVGIILGGVTKLNSYTAIAKRTMLKAPATQWRSETRSLQV